MGGGKTYSQLSAAVAGAAEQHPLADQVATVFKGETLRSMLLNAYGWWKVSQITYIISLAAFGLGTLSFLAGLFGFASLRRDRKPATAQVGPAIEQINEAGHEAGAPPDNRGADLSNESAPAGQRANRGSAPRSISARRSGAGGQRGCGRQASSCRPTRGVRF